MPKSALLPSLTAAPGSFPPAAKQTVPYCPGCGSVLSLAFDPSMALLRCQNVGCSGREVGGPRPRAVEITVGLRAILCKQDVSIHFDKDLVSNEQGESLTSEWWTFLNDIEGVEEEDAADRMNVS